jgi:hypothetical protein
MRDGLTDQVWPIKFGRSGRRLARCATILGGQTAARQRD